MRIIISPAKKMKIDTDSFLTESSPIFLHEAERLQTALNSMTVSQLKSLWKCSDSLVELNVQRLKHMDLHTHLTPAFIAYEGIQYQYMAPDVFDFDSLNYIREHLRILSGFYGILRPFDGVTPYRLEMQAKLPLEGHSDLYSFWGSKLADVLSGETDFVLNLASNEYSRAVKPFLPNHIRFITCVFAELKNGKPIEKGTFCKMARGQMVRWLAENKITTPEQIQNFNQLGYCFSKEHSTTTEFVFLKPSI